MKKNERLGLELSKTCNCQKKKKKKKKNRKIISNNEEVVEIFNSYFLNMADGTGKDYVFNLSDHQSLKMIAGKQFDKDAFDFKPTDQKTVSMKKRQ